MSETTEQTRPCPFCGGIGNIRDSGSGEYWVQCSGCWASAPVKLSPSEASAAWKTRALAPIEAFGRDAQRLDGEATKAGNSSKP